MPASVCQLLTKPVTPATTPNAIPATTPATHWPEDLLKQRSQLDQRSQQNQLKPTARIFSDILKNYNRWRFREFHTSWLASGTRFHVWFCGSSGGSSPEYRASHQIRIPLAPDGEDCSESACEPSNGGCAPDSSAVVGTALTPPNTVRATSAAILTRLSVLHLQ